MIKISIIVPVYNVEDYIEKCLESLFIQTLEDIEIIIVNDGSTDKSISKIYKYNDKRVKVINQENAGLSAARNTGLSVACGEYVMFVDSDDFINHKEALIKMYEKIKEEKSDILVGNAYIYFDEENQRPLNSIDKGDFISPLDTTKYMIKCLENNNIFVPVWLYMYKREFLNENQLEFKQGIYHEDEEFTPRVLIKAKQISIYNNCFYSYRQRIGSIMNNKNLKRATDVFDICFYMENMSKNMSDKYQRLLFRNYLANMAIAQIEKYQLKDVDKKIQRFIFRNSKNYKLRLKSSILLISPRLYLILNKMKKYSK